MGKANTPVPGEGRDEGLEAFEAEGKRLDERLEVGGKSK